MRTTLSIDDDVLAIAKELAAAEQKSIGQVISHLARRALRREPPQSATRNGLPLLPSRPGALPIPSELVHQLAEELE